MCDLLSETQLTLTDLARERNVNVATVWRWAKRGVGGAVLETIAIGGRRWTSREAFARFVTATTAKVVGCRPAAATPRRRLAAERRAAEELSAAGI